MQFVCWKEQPGYSRPPSKPLSAIQPIVFGTIIYLKNKALDLCRAAGWMRRCRPFILHRQGLVQIWLFLSIPATKASVNYVSVNIAGALYVQKRISL